MALLRKVQQQQSRANRLAGYAVAKPSQASLAGLKKRITVQEKGKMEILNEAPDQAEAP